MALLTEDQIRYGINHLKTSDPDQQRVIELAEWRGETNGPRLRSRWFS